MGTTAWWLVTATLLLGRNGAVSEVRERSASLRGQTPSADTKETPRSLTATGRFLSTHCA